MRAATLLIALTTLAPLAAGAQDAARAVRVQGTPPTIDGVLDDDAWRYAPPVKDFLQRNPVEGAAPSESTEVRFVYSDRDLYVAFRGYDREPGRVYGRLVRRDQRTAADYFTLFIDSFHDRRTAFEFSINPSGARRDVFIYDDGGGRDDSWDPVYDWATRTDSLGWTVELRIPFSQLRFSGTESVVFGVRIRRSINRRNEEQNWPFFPRDQAGEVSRYGELVGLSDVPTPRRMELLPYTAGSAAFSPAVLGDPFATGEEASVRMGGDLKLGVGSGLTLDLTANPDFGQVEADPAVVNLSAFETFFPEKRPFFIEGTNLFQFGMTPPERNEFGGGRGDEEGLVYTRRIGRAPQTDADDGGGYAEDLRQTTILGAAKLTGQAGKGWALGLAQALTARETVRIVDSLGADGRAPVEPLTSYTAIRAQRTLRRGRLTYGAMLAGVVRDLNDPAFDELHTRAFSGGVDVHGRFGGDRFVYDVALLGSRVEGPVDALIRTQRRSARYFQRPDQTHARLDSSRTALDGFAAYAHLAKAVGFATWNLFYGTRSPGFDINDLGFLRQTDLHVQAVEAELRWLTPGSVFREFEWRVEERAEFTYGGERTRTTLETRLSGDFLNYWNLNLNVERAFPALATRLLRGGPALREPGAWEWRLGGRTDFRRPVSINGGVTREWEDGTGAGQWRANAGVRLRPPGSVSLSLDGRATWETNDRQYITQETVGDSTYYVFGRLERRELSVTLRADLALSPKLSFEFYAQPFASVGRYAPLKLAADPKAQRYADRFDGLDVDRATRPGGDADVSLDVDRDGRTDFTFDEPDFRLASLRTSAVLRWEFRPGSTLFLVWQQDRRDETTLATGSPFGAIGDGFSAEGTNVFAMKIAYWLGL